MMKKRETWIDQVQVLEQRYAPCMATKILIIQRRCLQLQRPELKQTVHLTREGEYLFWELVLIAT